MSPRPLVFALGFAFVALVGSCREDRPHELPAQTAADQGIEAKSRRSTVMNRKLAWGGIVTNGRDRSAKAASVVVVAKGAGGAEVGRGSARVIGEGTRMATLPPHYGVRIEVNGIALSGAPERVEVRVEGVELAKDGDASLAFKPAQVAWDKALPDGVSFAVEEAKCGTVLDPSGKGGTFGCTLGLRHAGTRAVHGLALRFKSPRSDESVDVTPPHATDLPIEPGDAIVFEVGRPVKKPSEMILSGVVTDAR